MTKRPNDCGLSGKQRSESESESDSDLVVVFFPAGKTASDDYTLGADACLLYCRL